MGSLYEGKAWSYHQTGGTENKACRVESSKPEHVLSTYRSWFISHFSSGVLRLCRPAVGTAQIQGTGSHEYTPDGGRGLGLTFFYLLALFYLLAWLLLFMGQVIILLPLKGKWKHLLWMCPGLGVPQQSPLQRNRGELLPSPHMETCPQQCLKCLFAASSACIYLLST